MYNDISYDVEDVLRAHAIEFRIGDDSYFDGDDDVQFYETKHGALKLVQNVDKVDNVFVYSCPMLSAENADAVHGRTRIMEFVQQWAATHAH